MAAATAPVDDTRLPTQLRRLVRAVGWDRTMALVKARGGQRIRIPQHETDVVLADVIGAEGVEQLRREFGGLLFMDVPKGDKVLQQLRNQQARALRSQGATLNQVAAACGISRRHVLNVFRDADGAPDTGETGTEQADLFADAPDAGREPL